MAPFNDPSTKATMRDPYLSDEEHFRRLLESLPQDKVAAYNGLKFNRVEVVSIGARFVIYTMVNGRPQVHRRLKVSDFFVDSDGYMLDLFDGSNTISMDHKPRQLLAFPVFMSIPLSPRLRMVRADKSDKVTLTFPVFLRCMSRLHLREEGVTYCETEEAFNKEFKNAAS